MHKTSSSDSPALMAEALTRKFGRFTAVDAIDLEVRRGEIFAFLGPNGAGKTTAIRMFCGLLPPTSGEAWVDGLNIATDREQIKSQIGYMSQKFSLYDDLSVVENLTFCGGVYGLSRSETAAAAGPLLKRLGLFGRESLITRELPPGFKQRLALGCTILHRPRILFLDEPTAGVDPSARREFWDVIYELAAGGTTVFVTTHYMDEATRCNRVAIMKDGRLIALGTPGELRERYDAPTLQEAFHRAVAE
ncbi:MAG: ABC transporter ATP-binding protein [Calditrichaeota bacterium]|nr:ABC transporter ATP-binding protein [Calditrichota bacterium]